MNLKAIKKGVYRLTYAGTKWSSDGGGAAGFTSRHLLPKRLRLKVSLTADGTVDRVEDESGATGSAGQ
jgi:hypothetical protein